MWGQYLCVSEATRENTNDSVSLRSARAQGIPLTEWKGFTSPVNHAIRNSAQYDKWRKFVFERDNYTCAVCAQRGGKLNVHHIRRFRDYPDLRFTVSNGITLCKSCHEKDKGKDEERVPIYEAMLREKATTHPAASMMVP
ncbi:MAG: HNH endonuclease, partial [Proteobacteria bacterium]